MATKKSKNKTKKAVLKQQKKHGSKKHVFFISNTLSQTIDGQTD